MLFYHKEKIGQNSRQFKKTKKKKTVINHMQTSYFFISRHSCSCKNVHKKEKGDKMLIVKWLLIKWCKKKEEKRFRSIRKDKNV